MAVTELGDDLAVSEEEPTPAQLKARKIAETARANRAARTAAAPPPGKAKTVDDVIMRGASVGKVAEKRRTVLDKLVELGGEFDIAEPRRGRYGALQVFAELIGVKNGETLSGVILSMVKDKQIGVEKPHVRDMKRIYLIDPMLVANGRPKHKQEIEPAPESKPVAKKKASSKNLLPPLPALPALGSEAIVFAQILEDDGSITLGFKNDEGKFVTSVRSWQGTPTEE